MKKFKAIVLLMLSAILILGTAACIQVTVLSPDASSKESEVTKNESQSSTSVSADAPDYASIPDSDEIVLPNFVGKIYDTDIKDNSDYADFKFEITYGNVPSKQPGEVLRQTPAAGMTVKKGKTVSLTVNGEAEQVVVEDVKGAKQQDAYDTLKNLGLSPKIQAVADDDTAVGYVVKTDPAAGSTVSTGTTITIYVSSGPSAETGTIPEGLVGTSYSSAREQIEAAGFVAAPEYDDESDQDEGTVLSVSPSEGEKAKKGSIVTVKISSGITEQ